MLNEYKNVDKKLEYVTVPKHLQEVQNVNQFFVTGFAGNRVE